MKDVVIIGAGASGLAAARTLSKNKNYVVVLEARDRIGGRIHTVNDVSFTSPIEMGAEFMHGELPHTIALMNEVRVAYKKAEGTVWNVKNGNLEQGDFFEE